MQVSLKKRRPCRVPPAPACDMVPPDRDHCGNETGTAETSGKEPDGEGSVGEAPHKKQKKVKTFGAELTLDQYFKKPEPPENRKKNRLACLRAARQRSEVGSANSQKQVRRGSRSRPGSSPRNGQHVPDPRLRRRKAPLPRNAPTNVVLRKRIGHLPTTRRGSSTALSMTGTITQVTGRRTSVTRSSERATASQR